MIANITNETEIALSITNNPLGLNTICFDVNTQTIDRIKEVVISQAYQNGVKTLFAYTVVLTIVTIVTYHFFYNTYLKLSNRLKFGFLVILFLMQFLLTYATFLAFMIDFSIVGTIIFVVLLFPMFYYLIMYIKPLMAVILDDFDSLAG